MFAYCGLDCSKCEGYIATQTNDDNKRADVADKWSAQYKAEIKPEHINCNGCKADGAKFYHCSNLCEIRKCCIEKSLANCAACSDYICEKLNAFITLAPEARTALDKIRAST